MSVVAVLGASGPLGTWLSEHLSLRGYDVRPLSRRSDAPGGPVDVLRGPAPAALAGVDHVVYCAWSTSDRSEAAQRVHVRAAGAWATWCGQAGVGFHFTSTTLARAADTSAYGRHKHDAELLVTSAGGVAHRLGLVTDDGYPFLATSVRRLVRRAPVAARLLDVPVFAVSSTDVGAALTAELEAPRRGATVWVAPEAPGLLSEVARWGVSGAARRGTSLALRAAAALPARSGPLARHVDAVRGLVAVQVAPVDLARPRPGPVPHQGWAATLIA